MQKERGSSRSLSLHEEIEREAQEIEKEMSRHPELDDIQVTEEMDAALLNKIQAYEQDLEEEREAVKKVEENLRRKHYLSALGAETERAGKRADMEAAAGHPGKHTGARDAVRRFKVPGDSVEFAAELMPEIPRGLGLGGRDAREARDNGTIITGEAAGYVGYMGAKGTGYGERVEATVPAYACNNIEETASGYGEGMEDAVSGYREGMGGSTAEYAEKRDAAETERVVECSGAESVVSQGNVAGNVEGSAAEDNGEGKILYRKKKRKYLLLSLAAVLVIVLGVGGTSVGSKSHWKVLWEAVTGEPMDGIDMEDMRSTNTEDVDEVAVYNEITEKLNIDPVRIRYRPDDMKLVDYEIQEEMLTSQLLYKYEGEVIRYFLYMNDTDSSLGQNKEDNKIDEYTISVNGVEIKVKEFEKAEDFDRQEANFKYQGVHYQLKGVMEREEFEKILENLYFF